MGLFDRLAADGHEEVVHCFDRASGLRAIVAIHSTVLGPAVGGTRWYPYASEEQALEDVLRLSRGMTYKNAAAGLDMGGGKAVILGDPGRERTEEKVRAYGRFVGSLGGRYRTAEDVGTTQDDMDLIRRETPYVTGTSTWLGGSGDPSPATAWGVLHAIAAALAHERGHEVGPSVLEEVVGAHVVVVGVGKVGGALVGHLTAHGARVQVADIDAARVAQVAAAHGATVVDLADAHRTPCDVLSPCALGAVLSERTIPELACRVVAGAANNQLEVPEDGERLAGRGVLYVPDFIVNAGGVINIGEELGVGAYDQARALAAVSRIAGNVDRVLRTAAEEGCTTAEAADRVAERRIAAVGALASLRAAER